MREAVARALIPLATLVLTLPILAQSPVTVPRAHFGFNIGDDYSLANYTRMIAYWQKLDRESDRLSLVDIGKTSEGRTMTMAVVTSPANQSKLAAYRDIAKRLSKAENLTESQARELAAEGKAIVWIDGGLHATETLGSQQLIETERFGQIVVRAGVEAAHAVVETVARGEHEHRHRGALRAQASADFHPVDAGDHHVEDHRVVLVVVQVLERGAAVCRAVDRVAVLAQSAREHGGEAGVVFHDEEAHAAIVSP